MKKLEEPDQGYLTSTSSEMQFQTKQSLNNSKAASLCSKRTLVPTPHTNNRKAVASYCDDQSLPIKLSVNTYHPDNFPQQNLPHINHQEILYGNQSGVTPETN